MIWNRIVECKLKLIIKSIRHMWLYFTPHRIFCFCVVPPTPDREVIFSGVTHVRQGGSVRLRCLFDGHPTPSVRWLKNGEPFESFDPRIRVKNSDSGIGELMINATLLAESSGGMYQCRATNSAGVAILTTWVDVMPNSKTNGLCQPVYGSYH